MSGQDLSTKESYFNAQALLDLSDDERDFPDYSYRILECAFAESQAMPLPKTLIPTSNVRGTVVEARQADFQAHTARQRTSLRHSSGEQNRPSTAPEPNASTSLPDDKRRNSVASSCKSDHGKRSKRVAPLPECAGRSLVPFHKQVGVLPRELKNGKNVKPAVNIKLEPEHKQLLQGKVVYFYPNDDISMARRMRIHKIIQLGAAWVNTWRDDITHIMLDDTDNTYAQLLRHLNMAIIPVNIMTSFFGIH